MQPLFICLLILAMAVPVTAAVTRCTPTEALPPGSEFEVILTVHEPAIGGIIESIPDGFSYISSTHPECQCRVSGQTLIFAVINETEITYRVKSPGAGTGTFTGRWENFMTRETGETPGTTIIIAGTAGTPASAPQETPGFAAAPAFATLTALALLISRKEGR